MLSILLCSGRAHVDDYNYSIDGPDGSPPRKKASFSGSSKRKVTKLQIGAPSDFRHESHMGYDEVAGLDMDRYQQEFMARGAVPPSPTISKTQEGAMDRSPSLGVKRKPVPSATVIPSVDGFADDATAAFAYIAESNTPPTSISPSASRERSGSYATSSRPRQQRQSSSSSVPGAGSPPVIKKPLVPLLGERSDNPYYVTQTTKLRFDGALAEIEKALNESR